MSIKISYNEYRIAKEIAKYITSNEKVILTNHLGHQIKQGHQIVECHLLFGILANHFTTIKMIDEPPIIDPYSKLVTNHNPAFLESAEKLFNRLKSLGLILFENELISNVQDLNFTRRRIALTNNGERLLLSPNIPQIFSLLLHWSGSEFIQEDAWRFWTAYFGASSGLQFFFKVYYDCYNYNIPLIISGAIALAIYLIFFRKSRWEIFKPLF